METEFVWYLIGGIVSAIFLIWLIYSLAAREREDLEDLDNYLGEFAPKRSATRSHFRPTDEFLEGRLPGDDL